MTTLNVNYLKGKYVYLVRILKIRYNLMGFVLVKVLKVSVSYQLFCIWYIIKIFTNRINKYNLRKNDKKIALILSDIEEYYCHI